MKMAESYPNRKKTLWEKEKLLVTSNFFYSHSVFQKTCTADTSKPGLVWERANMTKKLEFLLGMVENIVEKEKLIVTCIFPFCDDISESILFQVIVLCRLTLSRMTNL